MPDPANLYAVAGVLQLTLLPLPLQLLQLLWEAHAIFYYLRLVLFLTRVICSLDGGVSSFQHGAGSIGKVVTSKGSPRDWSRAGPYYL